ncbi:MAG: hypothetical protein ABW022_27735 [Actinoplanes sp.]
MTSPTFKGGMTVTIRRGKNRGETATVESAYGNQVVVKLADGSISLQNAASLKAPEVALIDADTLAEAMTRIGDLSGTHGKDALDALANDLGNKALPGFSAKSLNFSEATLTD